MNKQGTLKALRAFSNNLLHYTDGTLSRLQHLIGLLLFIFLLLFLNWVMVLGELESVVDNFRRGSYIARGDAFENAVKFQ